MLCGVWDRSLLLSLLFVVEFVRCFGVGVVGVFLLFCLLFVCCWLSFVVGCCCCLFLVRWFQ